MKPFFTLCLLTDLPSLSMNHRWILSQRRNENKSDSMMSEEEEKRIPIETPSGRFHVWTKRIGENPRIKVLLLHGGPGASHEPFECFEKYFPREGIEFYYYNQLGSYLSDQPTDTNLWTIDRFVNEVEQVRQALGLNAENFFLFGHSWGGLLALEYAFAHQENLKGLIISNMMSSCPEYGRYANDVLAKSMDPDVVQMIRDFEAKNDFKNPQYMEVLIRHFYTKHFCRLNPWPKCLTDAMSHLNEEIYVLMQGPSEFGIAGRIKDWNRSDDLSKLHVPTLVIGGHFDTMDPNYLQWMAKQIPRGSSLICSRGSHFSMWDDEDDYFNGLIKFLYSVDIFAKSSRDNGRNTN